MSGSWSNWKHNRYDRKEHRSQWSSHLDPDGAEQDKWARTDDGNTPGSTTATFENPQANDAPQHGGSSGAYGDSAAPAANEGFKIVMSQLSDRKEDGTGPAHTYIYPPVIWMVVRRDLDTIQFVASDVHRKDRKSREFLFDVWNSATNGHQSRVRSHFYHCTNDFKIAKQRAERGNLRGKKRLQDGFIVTMDVWDMFKQNKIKDEDFIDLSTEEAQRRFFDENIISQENLYALTYQKNYKECMLCFKGLWLECWYMTDPDGNPTELLKPLLDVDAATGVVRGWKRKNRSAGGGAQPRPPGNAWQAAAPSAVIRPSAAPVLPLPTTVAAGQNASTTSTAGTCGTTMDSRASAELAQDQAMSVTCKQPYKAPPSARPPVFGGAPTAAGSPPAKAPPATPSNSNPSAAAAVPSSLASIKEDY